MQLNKSNQYKSNLSKNDSALTVFCTQISGLIKAIQLILPHIAIDQDVEYLHQYRVSLRKIEALLIVFHDFVPKKILLNMKTECKFLFAASGQLRDFDLLLNKLLRTNPKSKDKFLDITLIQEITAKRQAEFEAFLLTTQKSEYSDRFVRLQGCLSTIEQCSSHISLQECWPTLMKESMHNVYTAYQRLWKKKDDSHIHKLRKSLKQLRYCIELIGVIVKPRKARLVLSWLKSQQESLGNYNDVQVQSALLTVHCQASKKVKCVFVVSDLSHVRKSLPLSKSEWKILRKKLQPLIG